MLVVPPEKLTTPVPVPVMPEETAKVPPSKSSTASEATWRELLDEIVPPFWSDNVPDVTASVAAPTSLKAVLIELFVFAPSLIRAPSFSNVPPEGVLPAATTFVLSAVNVKVPVVVLSKSAPLERLKVL